MPADTILIVAPEQDAHAQAVASVLKSAHGVEVAFWDVGRFPASTTSTLRLDGKGRSFSVVDSEKPIDFSAVRSIWWRRAQPAEFDPAITDTRVRAFCRRESDAFLRGAVASLGVPVINSPTQEWAARKPIQLRAAQQVGLTIPRTVMTNSPDEVRAFFAAAGGRCIYKSFTPPSFMLAETRELTHDLLGELDSLRHAPMIVQEKIEKGRDIRVTVVVDRVFAASVTTHVPEAELDWRLDATAVWAQAELPRETSEQLIQLLRRLGLQYGCIDLRQQADGEYVFFEVNPSGQFLFVEIDTAQPITRAMADMLVGAESRS
jgi:glutathione synthase/RimK-type ligase-like ATP-grasp enzyme